MSARLLFLIENCTSGEDRKDLETEAVEETANR